MYKITNGSVPFQQSYSETPSTSINAESSSNIASMGSNSSNIGSTEPDPLYTLITTDKQRIQRPIAEFRIWKNFERPKILGSMLDSSQDFQMKIPLSSHAFLFLESFLKENANPHTKSYSQNNLRDSLVAYSFENTNREPIINLISLMADIDSFATSYDLQELSRALTNILKESEILNLFNEKSIEQLLQFIDNDCNSLDHKFIHKLAWLGLTSLFKNDLVLSDLLHQFATKLNINDLSTPNELSNWFQEAFSADFALKYLQTILHNKESALFEKNFDFALSLIKDYFPNYFDQSSSSPYQHFFTYMMMTIADQIQTTEQANKFFQLFKDLSPLNKDANIQFSPKELETMDLQRFIPVRNFLHQPQIILLSLVYQRIIKNIMNITPYDAITIKNVSLTCFNMLCHFEDGKEDAIWRIIEGALEIEFRSRPKNGLGFFQLILEIKLNKKVNDSLLLLKKHFPDYFNPLNPSPNEQIFTYMLTAIAKRVETAEQAKKLFQFLEALYSTNKSDCEEDSSISPGLLRDLSLIALRHMTQNFMKEEPHDIPKIAEAIVQCFNCFKHIGADNEQTIWYRFCRIEFPNMFVFPNTKKGQLEHVHFLIKLKNSLETHSGHGISHDSINKILVPEAKAVSDWEEEDVDNILALAQQQLHSKFFEKILIGAMKSGISTDSKYKIIDIFQDQSLGHYISFNFSPQNYSNEESPKDKEMQKIIDFWVDKNYKAAQSSLTQIRYLNPFIDLFCKQRGVVDTFEFFYSLEDFCNSEDWQNGIFNYLNHKPLNFNKIIQFLTLLNANNQPFYFRSLFKFLKLTIEDNADELRNEILGRIIEHLRKSETNLQIEKIDIVPWSALLKIKNEELKQLEELTILLMTKGFNQEGLRLNYPYLCAICLYLEIPLVKFSDLSIEEQMKILMDILALPLPHKVFSKVLEMSLELYRNDSFSQLDQNLKNPFNDKLIDKMFKHGMALTPRKRHRLFGSSLFLNPPNHPRKLIKLLFMQYFATPNEDSNKESIKSSLCDLLPKRDAIFRKKDKTSFDLIEDFKDLDERLFSYQNLQFLKRFGKKLAPHGIDELRELRNIFPHDFRLDLTLEFLSGDNNKKSPVDILNLFSRIRFDRCESIIYSILYDRLPKIAIEHNAELVSDENDDVQMTEEKGVKRKREECKEKEKEDSVMTPF